jgi:hypothetical protein
MWLYVCPEIVFCWFWKSKTLQNHNRDQGLRNEIPLWKWFGQFKSDEVFMIKGMNEKQ